MKSNLLKSIFISLILLVGGTNAWAGEGFYGIYIKYNHNGTAKTSDGEWTNPLTLGTLTSDFKVTDVYLKVWWESWSPTMSAQLHYWKDGNEQWSGTFKNVKSTGGNNHEVYVENWNKVLASTTETSGSHEITYKWEAYFSGVTHTLPSSGTKKITYTVAPPAVKSFTVTHSGDVISGSGEQADPYIIRYNGSLTLTLSGSQNHTDANSTLQYNTSGTWNTTATKTISSVTTTTVQNVTVKARYTNKTDANLNGAESSKTIYYRAENAYAVTINNDGHGTTTPSGAQSNVGQVTGLSIKATPAANYEFVNWTITSGSGSFGSATSASTTFKPTSAATIQANFRSTATHSLTVEAGNGISQVAGSTNPVTLGNTYDIKATPKTGYTFSTWTANPAANASFGSATTANTTVTVKNGSVTVTASATENMSTLTTSNKYEAGDPGYAVPNATVSKIGIATTATVIATAAGTGYTFVGWELTNCERTDGGTATATSITVKSNGDGKAATVVAKYEEDLSTAWSLAHSIDDFNTSSHKFIKKTGESTGKVAYVSLELAANTAYRFKVVKGSTWYGNNNSDENWWIKSTTENWDFWDNAGDCHMKSSVAGTYTFKIDFSGSNPKISVYFPTSYTVNYSQTPTAAADAPTTDPSITSGALVLSGTEVTFTAQDAKPGYAWKGWYDNNEGTGTALSTNKVYTRSIDADTKIYAVYTLNSYTITYILNDGTNPNDAPTSYNVTTATFDLPNPNKTGYTFAGWFDNEELTGNAITQIAKGTTDDKEFWAKWTANTYTVKFNANGGSGSMADQTFTYNEEEKALTANTFTQSGYDFVGWNTLANGTGTPYTDSQKVQNLTDKANGTITLYAQWQGAEYTVTLDQTGAASIGTEEVIAHYKADMPSIPELPVAQNGYAFMGYFDQKDGLGTQYYYADGTSAHTWDKTENATLYAYFKAAEITINLNAASFEPNSATPVIATATLKPEPVGTTSICWELLYDDDTPVAEHDPQPIGDNQVQFNINDLATGTYQIKATLREGAGCEGTIISHATQVFTITSDHTITIKYVDENGQTIKASTTQSAHVSSTTTYTAPNIVGYTFSNWEAGDGVTITETNGKEVTFNAIYDGYLTAKYTKNSNIIYFYNTLGWENVYVYFYNDANGYKYWEDNYGTGAHQNKNFGNWDRKPFWEMEHGQMEQITGTNIWYFQMKNKRSKVAFANVNQTYTQDDDVNNTTSYFQNANVVYRYDLDSEGRLPMFVPDTVQSHYMASTKSTYYNHGYWMNYPNHSGYTLDLFNHHTDNDPARSFVYPYSKNTIFPLQLEVEINAENVVEGNKKIWFRIQRNDKKNFGGDATTFPTVNPGTTGGFIADNDYKVELITPIAGTYTFTLDYTYNDKTKDYQYRIDVDYPASVGDYRILYSDEAVTNWSGNTKPDGWYHPSRVIKKGEDRKDIISFYINTDVQRRLSYQTIQSIDNKTGAITWNTEKVPFSYIDWSQIKESGVYNFTFVQDDKGISVENDIVPYEGNYYIRCDAMDGNWEDYKTNPDNRMFYSAFSESDANSFGDKFSHYATKWCEAGTNVKFTIANDYSHCISDTLAQDINSLGNLTDEGTLLNNDIYDVNIRFMWNRKTNKISRAYVGPAGDKQSQFLMLQSCSEFKDAAGNDLNPAEGDILDKEKNIYAARFTDTQNWIYERTIQVKPRTRVKLYASYPNGYHIYIENNTGWKDVALYAFKNGGGEPLGTWPGVQPTRTVKIGDKTYYDFPVNKYVFGSTLIFNNNVKENGQQTNNFPISNTGDYYLTASKQNQLSQSDYVQTTVEATAQYFRGEYAEGSCDDEHTIQILGGEGETWNTIRVIYDFKTNRLMAAWMPNNNEIDTERSIESDVMIIRDHQNAAQCITFANDDSKLTNVKTVYGVMRFNRWILNNRGGEDNLDIESCTKMVDNQTVYDHDTINKYHPILETAKQTSQYERALYFISFPFDVHLSDVFGFGTYGQHWIIEYYDGLKRAKEGYWIDSDPNWKYVTDPANFVLEKYKGYILCLNLGKMAYDNTDFWAHNISQVELFFPSTTTMEEIAKAEVTMPKLGEEYLCKINRGDGTEGDRRVKDSYWRCIGVPSYANYSNVLKDEEGKTIKWQTNYKTLPFLYRWNKTDNTLTAQSTTNFTFETMHAYLVQNGGEIHWSAVNATPDKPNAGIIAKVKETTRNYEWRITLTQGEKEHDQTFVRLSDNEQVTTEFDFNQDLSKEFNYGRSDIYTLIGYEKAAANSLPLSEQTTLIPLGLSIEYNGDYTIAMPDGTANIGVTLIDTESNTRTNLSAGMEYTLTLKKGDYNNRFFIEISPIQQTPTDIEYVTGDSNSQNSVRKVLIDNILYIVRDGQIFDARGVRVK